MQKTSQFRVQSKPILTPHLVRHSTGWTYVITDPDSVSTNYSEAASQSASEPVRLLSVCSWSMTVFPHTNYSETVVQLCGGLALSHTISTTIDWQRVCMRRAGERERDSHVKWGRKMQNEKEKKEKSETVKLPKSFSLSGGVMTHAVALKRRFVYCVCIHMRVCTLK